jgi:hypothetical protein
MSSGYIKTIGRRQFLRGAGGLALALPFLPSLMPRGADADPTKFPKRFVAMATSHGGIWHRHMFPDRATLTEQRMYAGHTIRAGALRASASGGRASLSPVLSASDTLLTPSRVARMNVLQGIDVPFYLAHHTGGHLGNYARNDGNGSDGKAVQAFPRITIDQLMAWSREFYPSLDGVVQRALVTGAGRMSYNYTNPAAPPAGQMIQDIVPTNSSRARFNELFMPGEQGPQTRTPIADRVLESYNRLRNGDRRLSAEDRRRLDDHIQRLQELQRKVNVQTACGVPEMPTRDAQDVRRQRDYEVDPAKMIDFWQLHNEVMAAALLCGASRIGVMHCAETFSTFEGNWHEQIAHKAELADNAAQGIIRDAHQRFFEGVFMDLVARLDVEEAPGVNLLDNTLVMWTQESGNITHDSYSIPIVTAGAAGGFFRTGQYVDYRNSAKIKRREANREEDTSPGLIYNQWLGNVLQSMGISPAAYEQGGVGGYGHLYIGTERWYLDADFYPDAVQRVMGERLPFITT